jgi:uncharacterized membrane protein YdbT with pleckstrin-like domain
MFTYMNMNTQVYIHFFVMYIGRVLQSDTSEQSSEELIVEENLMKTLIEFIQQSREVHIFIYIYIYVYMYIYIYIYIFIYNIYIFIHMYKYYNLHVGAERPADDRCGRTIYINIIE